MGKDIAIIGKFTTANPKTGGDKRKFKKPSIMEKTKEQEGN